ncbi:hypothetical protein SJAG_03962 [Schizosaccharomyces japonicus yFS275]|uniref:Uncharacterized protein n=1 Tax=Schizosaccharomyces japonicus (strain yFS275 / FY16936) TaxID=402676 RepID=B6K5I8_SCHJY|nr:hypothetical protein SJAG_03962 [Schizosaccharomyces japonicus yFS275]EEB08792.2 hypothetical protein SJAG_03962 [Schizosaccharomyces japonicus yFS275]
MKPLVGPGLAWFCTGISAIGILFLLVLSYLFANGAETLIHDLEGSDLTGKQVAKTCLGAVGIYVITFLFCGSQVLSHRNQRPIHI